MRARQVAVWLGLSVLYLLVFEVAVRWGWPQDKHTEHLAGASLGEKDPLLGHRLRAGAHSRTRTPEFTVEYRTNADGWRDETLYDRQAAAPRLLVLGDSFTFGEGVDEGQIFPRLLERGRQQQGTEIEVVNAGVPGYDTRREVLLLERLLERYRPDAVLIVWVPNDLFTNRPLGPEAGNTPSEGTPSESPSADIVTVRQEKKKRPTLHSVSLLRRLALASDALYVRLYADTGRGRFFAAEPDPVVEEQLQTTAELLRRAQTLCAERGASLAVVSLPQQFQVLLAARDAGHDGLDAHLLDRRLAAVAAASGFAFWPLLDDLARVYRDRGEDLYYRLDGHLNARGHRAVATALDRRLSAWLAAPGARP